MAAKRKDKLIMLKSDASHHMYTTDRKAGPEKLMFKKYDPITRKHEIYREKKLPGSK